MKQETPGQPPENSVEVTSRAQWRKWLTKNHARTQGVWLITYKLGASRPRVTYDEVVEEALCFGWVDSKGAKLDVQRTMLWIAPRKAKSGWSKLNKDRVEKLEAAGLIAPPGAAVIAAARLDGSWSKLDAVESLDIPPDLATAFRAAGAVAAKNFDAFPRSAKRGILEWITQAKRAETRAARILETATLAQRNERANQWRK